MSADCTIHPAEPLKLEHIMKGLSLVIMEGLPLVNMKGLPLVIRQQNA